MRINACIALVLSPLVSSVLTGAGVAVILAIPALRGEARLYLLQWAAFSLWATPPIALGLAPRLRSRAYHLGLREP